MPGRKVVFSFIKGQSHPDLEPMDGSIVILGEYNPGATRSLDKFFVRFPGDGGDHWVQFGELKILLS
jgi:hypothetical protein